MVMHQDVIVTAVNVALVFFTGWRAGNARTERRAAERAKADCQRYFDWLQADFKALREHKR